MKISRLIVLWFVFMSTTVWASKQWPDPQEPFGDRDWQYCRKLSQHVLRALQAQGVPPIPPEFLEKSPGACTDAESVLLWLAGKPSQTPEAWLADFQAQRAHLGLPRNPQSFINGWKLPEHPYPHFPINAVFGMMATPGNTRKPQDAIDCRRRLIAYHDTRPPTWATRFEQLEKRIKDLEERTLTFRIQSWIALSLNASEYELLPSAFP